MTDADPLPLDLSDFDAVGIAADVVAAVRVHAIETSTESSATVSAPEGWHRVVVNCSPTGNTVLRVRFADLTRSRANNVAAALADRDWQRDEDDGGASHRHGSGTDATTVAFDVLGALTVGGAPSDIRSVSAVDGAGNRIAL